MNTAINILHESFLKKEIVLEHLKQRLRNQARCETSSIADLRCGINTLEEELEELDLAMTLLEKETMK